MQQVIMKLKGNVLPPPANFPEYSIEQSSFSGIFWINISIKSDISHDFIFFF